MCTSVTGGDSPMRSGSRPDHPLHPAFIAKNEAASAWIVEKQNAAAAAA
jgi:hypothetical protein